MIPIFEKNGNEAEQSDAEPNQERWSVAIAAVGDRTSIATLRSRLGEKWLAIATPHFGRGYVEWENRTSPRETRFHDGHTPLVVYAFECPHRFSTALAVSFAKAFPGIRAVALSLLRHADGWTLSSTYFDGQSAEMSEREGKSLPPKVSVLAEAELLRTRSAQGPFSS